MSFSFANAISRRSLLSLPGLAVPMFTGCRGKAKPFPGFAAVVKAGSSSVALVDLGAFTLAGAMDFPAPVSQLFYRPDTRKLYAVSAEAGTIFEYDWAARRHQRAARVSDRLAGARLDPDQASLWVSTVSPAGLVRIPLREFVPGARIPLPSTPVALDVANWGGGLAASLSGGGVAMLHPADGSAATILRDQEIFGIVRFRSDGRQLLASNHAERSISVLRMEDARALVDLPVGMEARYFCFKPDGGQLFVTDGESGGVAIVYPYTTEVDRAVLAGKSPGAMAACAGPPYLLVANRESSDVTILDLDSGKLVAVVPVGAAPDFIAITPDNQYALVLNKTSGDMAVIRLSAVRSQRNKTAPLFTMIPVGEAPESLAVIPS